MKLLSLVFVVLLMGLSAAAEPIPNKDFISITEKALDALDEAEVVFSRHDSTKQDAKAALNKLEIATLKYERYLSGKWPDGKQKKIAENISRARFEYGVYLVTEGQAADMKESAEAAAKTARALFVKYKKTGAIK